MLWIETSVFIITVLAQRTLKPCIYVKSPHFYLYLKQGDQILKTKKRDTFANDILVVTDDFTDTVLTNFIF
jgi:hypothetical protein